MSALALNFMPVGRSRAMASLRRLLAQAAPSDCTVLLTGETGTGKERAARYLHQLSGRRAGPFVPINCGAIPTELFESELFGHEKGAFTGALSARMGRFQLAEGGTLFLDEIGDLPLTLQVKLLRVLQERRVERVGGCTSVACSVRIIAATNHDLEARVREGRFREDLYYRVNVFPVTLPPLRERSEDLSELIENLMPENAPAFLSAASLDVLTAYAWPGNVRELSNLLERLSILYPDQMVEPAQLPRTYQAKGMNPPTAAAGALMPSDEATEETAAGSPIDLKAHLSLVETRLIRRALGEAGGVVAVAARMLRLSRTTLVEKLRRMEEATPIVSGTRAVAEQPCS